MNLHRLFTGVCVQVNEFARASGIFGLDTPLAITDSRSIFLLKFLSNLIYNNMCMYLLPVVVYGLGFYCAIQTIGPHIFVYTPVKRYTDISAF